ncbi:uncharacterized protein LOC108111689 [Drosophila eugracilis]|uniref:uncharacterized protein LOC108111689 n=1 Tax=Drosophila eugracilis TaxID=29029 RepID=UPI001BD9CDFF|nr:uncharacterized protein LOC108111689 [Drosophila eugracilis]
MYIAYGICFCTFLMLASAVHEPENNCEQYFSYSTQNRGQTYIGIFTAHKNYIREFYWEAVFSARGSINQVGDLYLFPNNEVFERNIRNGQPAQVYVIFRDITTELPKLISLKLNGLTLCTNEKYPPFSITTRVARRINIKETQ